MIKLFLNRKYKILISITHERLKDIIKFNNIVILLNK